MKKHVEHIGIVKFVWETLTFHCNHHEYDKKNLMNENKELTNLGFTLFGLVAT